MSTTPTPAATTSFWQKLKQILPAIEMAGNVALLASGIGAGFEPLVAGLEGALNPLLQSIGSPQTVSNTLMNVYATIIAVLTTLKQTPGLPAATLSEIEAYITAAQNATAAYVQAQTGFNPANYTPVTPIA